MSRLQISNIAKRFTSQDKGPDETERLARQLAAKPGVAEVGFLPGGVAVRYVDGSVHAIGTGDWATV